MDEWVTHPGAIVTFARGRIHLANSYGMGAETVGQLIKQPVWTCLPKHHQTPSNMVIINWANFWIFIQNAYQFNSFVIWRFMTTDQASLSLSLCLMAKAKMSRRLLWPPFKGDKYDFRQNDPLSWMRCLLCVYLGSSRPNPNGFWILVDKWFFGTAVVAINWRWVDDTVKQVCVNGQWMDSARSIRRWGKVKIISLIKILLEADSSFATSFIHFPISSSFDA